MIEAIRNASITKRVYAISAIAGAGLVFVLAISLLQLRQTMLLDAETAIQHEVETAHGILATLQAQEVAGTMTRDQAQSAAKSMVQMLRYGNNEYFFIFDMQPRMIVNPFSPKLVGTYLGELVAQDGQHPFLEMLKKVESQGAGSIAYPWPKPGQPGSHPKLSYIKGFAPWGWVIATGVYLDDFEDAFRAMAVKLCAAVLAATILTLGCGIFVARGIVRRIGMVTDRATLLAQGDLARDVPFVSQRDALGQIARAIEVFRDAAVVKAGLEADAAVRQQREEENLKRVEQAYAAAAAGQTTVVRAMAEGLAQLAEGNLAYRLNQDFPSDYAKLKADFNSALAKMEQGMASIAGVTVSVGGGSDQIAHASDNLSRRTEQQAASLEQTAAALDAILATVKDMAAGARDTADVAVAARTAAEASSTVVRQAVEAMDKIRASSSEINNIIGVIDEIAFQTNLLALNAGVEAARAGEAGRGFAVVASEVRALAQRSASAAKEIKTLISSSAVQVENGVTFVGKTGLALKDITTKVADMAALVRNISSASAEQARGLAEINTAMTQMDQIVQENAAMVQQSAAVAHALKEESRDLSGMVGRFKIRRA